jgi:hypothetical protein
VLPRISREVGRFEPHVAASVRRCFFERPFLHREICLNVCVRGLMTKPERYDRNVYAGLKQMPGSGTPESVRRDSFGRQAGAGCGGALHGELKDVVYSVTGKRSSLGVRKQLGRGRGAHLSESVLHTPKGRSL